MKTVIHHEIYGPITYSESDWTGKKEIWFGSTPLVKRGKSCFVWKNHEGVETIVTVKGNLFSGRTLYIGAERVEVQPASKWYEIVCSFSILLFILVWGNSVTLCSILPLVGGAIGGAISGGASVLCLLGMKKFKNVGGKLLVWLAAFGATVLICFLLGLAILSLLL
ncbi:MAG: hypothetical protein IKB41_05760 [Clostridia bacterium]|nr:hypothetical protein [Clostridia bacterium]